MPKARELFLISYLPSIDFINDILDISNGVYKSYEDYVEHKKRIIEMVRNHNNKCFNPHNENYSFTYYVEPVILSQVVFYYIVNKCL